MENAAPTPQQPVAPQPQTPPAMETPKEKKGTNYLMYIVGLFAVVILIIGGVTLYKNFLAPVTVEVKDGLTTEYASLDSLESELTSLDEGSVDADFTELDKDLNSI